VCWNGPWPGSPHEESLVERVLSDNGSCYRSYAWRDACTALGITHKRTRPYRPQTNGKIERFHRTLADGWAYARHYTSEGERRAALPGWIHFYNHHRIHSAIGGHPPAGSTTCLDITTSRGVALTA
jgi:transposase InsO family protein